ncbi:MAG: four helix bundle protein [Patescibacteria group bacterium]
MKANSYKDLLVWQKSMDLVVSVYAYVNDFPQSELYGLASQMKRCAVSIPSNIAEGKKRTTKKDYLSFLIIAFSSGAELETQVEISKRLNFGNNEKRLKLEKQLEEVMRMLNSFISKLRNNGE